MKIESIIRRDGGSVVTLDDTNYRFKPEAVGGPHIAIVTDQAHLATLLAIPEGFRLAEIGTTASPEPAPSGEAAPKSILPAAESNPEIEAPTFTDGAEPAVVAGVPDASAPPANAEQARNDAVALYVAKHGRKPHHKWSVEKIIEELADKAAS